MLAIIEVATGLAAAAGLTHLLSKILCDVSSADPLTFALVAIILILVALAACYIPACRRQADPIIAPRYE